MHAQNTLNLYISNKDRGLICVRYYSGRVGGLVGPQFVDCEVAINYIDMTPVRVSEKASCNVLGVVSPSGNCVRDARKSICLVPIEDAAV